MEIKSKEQMAEWLKENVNMFLSEVYVDKIYELVHFNRAVGWVDIEMIVTSMLLNKTKAPKTNKDQRNGWNQCLKSILLKIKKMPNYDHK